VEGQILASFGYGHCADVVLKHTDGSDVTGQDGTPVTGDRFLDAYTDPDRRQHTEDMLTGFQTMGSTDPDYAAAKAYIGTWLKAYFGEPNTGAA
jgi:hypothetical protein